MKTILLKTLHALLFPLLWCRMVLQEASQACVDYDPLGYTDYMNFVAPEADTLPSPLENAANQAFTARFASSRHC